MRGGSSSGSASAPPARTTWGSTRTAGRRCASSPGRSSRPTASSPHRPGPRAGARSDSVQEPLDLVAILLVLGAALLHLRQARDLGGGDVPPDARVGQIAVRLGLAHDHARPRRFLAGLLERDTNLARSRCPPGPGAQTLGASDEVELDDRAVEPPARAAVTELV